jgi:hypothetical protein
VFLVFRPGIELLPLFAEAIALLPDARRWDVEFSSYLTTLPPGISCNWRGVLDGSPQAKSARRLPNALILDLGRHLGRAQGGGLVHLARTGERLDVADTRASAGLMHGSSRPPAVVAGRPPQPRTAGHAHPADADAGRDWLPDLANRLAADESLLGGNGLRRRGSRPLFTPIVLAVCLVPLLAAAIFLSPALRQRLGFEVARSAGAAGDRLLPAPDRADPLAHVDARPGEPKVAGVSAPLPGPAKGPEPLAGPVAEAKAPAKADAPPAETTKAGSPIPRPLAEPIMLAFKPPDVPGSALGSPVRQEGAIRLPEDTDGRIELLNGPGFLLSAVPGMPNAWEIATRTSSRLAGSFALARLSRADTRTWRFDWTKNAKAGSRSVEGFKDAILELHGPHDRPIYVLLRSVELSSDRPLVLWDKERILFDKLDPRTRSKPWAGDSNSLEGSHWKPRIRRWRGVLFRPETDEDDDDSPRLVIEPGHAEEGKASGAEPALACELIPGEVNLKLNLDPDRPGEIEVRVEPNPEKLRAGRADRSARMNELKKATPTDGEKNEQDPLEYRQSRLSKLPKDGAENNDEIKALEREIEDLKRITKIQATEDLLTRPARLELSVVIGLDVDETGILDIVRIGEFAGGR